MWRKSWEENDHCHRSWVSLHHRGQGAQRSWRRLWSMYCRSGFTYPLWRFTELVTNMSWPVWPPTTLCLFFFIIIFSPSQICANLDSVIVSTKHYAPELKEKVPRPIKTFDIVERRPEVGWFCFFLFVEFLKNSKQKQMLIITPHPNWPDLRTPR